MPTEMRQSAVRTRPWLRACSVYSHSRSSLCPAVSPYCSASASAAASSASVVSVPPARGARAVKLSAVNGNVAAFGFPASSEITPGTFSSGKRPRTAGRGGHCQRVPRHTARQEGKHDSLALGWRFFATSDRKAV